MLKDTKIQYFQKRTFIFLPHPKPNPLPGLIAGNDVAYIQGGKPMP